jgi:hypothetical protein
LATLLAAVDFALFALVGLALAFALAAGFVLVDFALVFTLVDFELAFALVVTLVFFAAGFLAFAAAFLVVFFTNRKLLHKPILSDADFQRTELTATIRVYLDRRRSSPPARWC